MTYISARGIRKSFRSVTALDGVTLEIRKGEFYGLLGPNGAGKTTLLRILCGLIEPDSGELSIDESPGRLDNSLALGVVPQEIALYDELSAEQNLDIFGELAGLRGDTLRERRNELLEKVGLTDRSRSQVKSYSGGMKRRLNLAVGLLHDPPILLLDEPTVGVDPQSRARIFALIKELHTLGKTIIYTTHYMEEAERLCTRIGILDRGTLLAEGTLEELLGGIKMRKVVRVYSDQQFEHFTDGNLVESRAGDGYTDLIPCRSDAVGALIAAVERSGLSYDRLELLSANLETLFLEMTGKELRD